jgi:hypothetical protein
VAIATLVLQGSDLMPKDWTGIIQAASKSPLGILALMILFLGVLGYVFFKDAGAKIKVVMYLAMLGGVIGYGAAISRATSNVGSESYRVRVIVVDTHQTPLSDAKVWSSIGGEPMKVEGGWLFVIAKDTKPLDGKVTFYVSKDAAFLKGQAPLQLGENHNPSVTVALENDRSAQVMGIVEDDQQTAIAGATVSVIGHDSEAQVTKASGNFSLPAHATDGQQVQLHAENAGYHSANSWCPVGDTPCTILLPQRTPLRAEHPSSHQQSGGSSQSQDQQNRNKVSAGNVAFKSEDTMQLGNTYPVLVLVSPTVSKADLQQTLESELRKASPDIPKKNADHGKMTTEEIRVTPMMRAHLSANADEFEISSLTPEDQDTTFEPVTKWEWNVKPIKAGKDLKLDLTLSLVVGSQGTPHALETYHRFILVKVSFPLCLQNFIAGNWQWLWATLLVPLAGWLWKRRRKQSGRNGSP